VIDSYYLLTLGSYRAFYILNWIWRDIENDGKVDPVSVIFGVIQTAFYIDFAWVYYSRQRVKLRHGGIVDADDMRAGWLLRTVFGHKAVVPDADEDEESAPALGGAINGDSRPNASRLGSSKWGARGISVSADDSVLAGERRRQNGFQDQEEGIINATTGEETDPDAKMRDPDELARILDDESDDDEGVLPGTSEPVGNGSEWREIGSKPFRPVWDQFPYYLYSLQYPEHLYHFEHPRFCFHNIKVAVILL
jgi:hypothetical protein